jgi:RNA 2',3'-cyclic 3'-phosphodiesterase
MANAQYRLFFAVELSPDIQTQLLSLQHRYLELKARPIPADNLHITLNFLGDVSEKKLESILDNFRAPPFGPFEVLTSQLVYWPKPGILAVSIDDPQTQLNQCKKHIDEQLSQIDFFQLDKKTYVPHITLFRNVEQPPKTFFAIAASIKASAVSLMVSQNSRNGVYYQTVESWPLKNPNIKHQLTGAP